MCLPLLFNKPFPIRCSICFHHLYLKFTCNSTRIFENISAISIFFFSKNVFIQKRRLKRKNRLCSLDLRRPNLGRLNYTRYLEYLPRYLTRLRFLKIYESRLNAAPFANPPRHEILYSTEFPHENCDVL